MKEDQHYIDKMFKDTLSGYSESPDGSSWKTIAGELALEKTGSVAWLGQVKTLVGVLSVLIYLAIGPLLYFDVLISKDRSAQVQGNEEILLSSTESDLSEAKTEGQGLNSSALQSEQQPKVEIGRSESKKLSLHQTAAEPATVSYIPSYEAEENDKHDHKSGEVLFTLEEDETSMISLTPKAYNYRSFVTPDVTLDSLPNSKIQGYYEENWGWFVGASVAPVQWNNERSLNLQFGAEVGKYLNGKSFVSLGIRSDISTSSFRGGLVSNQWLFTVKYQRLFGKGPLKFTAFTGLLYFPSSYGSPSDPSGFTLNGLDFEIGAGVFYSINSKLRAFIIPSIQQPLSSVSGFSVQTGLQLRLNLDKN